MNVKIIIQFRELHCLEVYNIFGPESFEFSHLFHNSRCNFYWLNLHDTWMLHAGKLNFMFLFTNLSLNVQRQGPQDNTWCVAHCKAKHQHQAQCGGFFSLSFRVHSRVFLCLLATTLDVAMLDCSIWTFDCFRNIAGRLISTNLPLK